jgi:hypothetical protein
VSASSLAAAARDSKPRPAWSGSAGGKAAGGAALCAPALWFVLTNLAVYQLHLSWAAALLPPVAFAGLLQSPLLLLGGPLLALLLVAPGMVGLRFRRAGDSLLLDGVVISARLAPALVLLVSAGCLAALTGYAFMENLGHLMRNAS